MRLPRHIVLVLLFALAACASPAWQTMPLTSPAFDQETFDFGMAPTSAIRTARYEGPTPLTIDGASTIVTGQLRDKMASANPPVVIDVLNGNQTVSLPAAIWLPEAGGGRDLTDAVQARLADHLAGVTAGDKNREIVLLCLSKTCWLSHNAAVRAVSLGYHHVYWYRGGRRAWAAAGLPLLPVHPVAW